MKERVRVSQGSELRIKLSSDKGVNEDRVFPVFLSASNSVPSWPASMHLGLFFLLVHTPDVRWIITRKFNFSASLLFLFQAKISRRLQSGKTTEAASWECQMRDAVQLEKAALLILTTRWPLWTVQWIWTQTLSLFLPTVDLLTSHALCSIKTPVCVRIRW